MKAQDFRFWLRWCVGERVSMKVFSQTWPNKDLQGQESIGEIRELTDEIKLDRYYQHTIEVVVDRLVRKDGMEQRLTQSLETALTLAEGVADIEVTDGPTLTFSQHLACGECGLSFEDLQPRNFSFNSPYGRL